MRTAALVLIRGTGPRLRATSIRRQFGIQGIKDFLVKAWKDTYPDEMDHSKSFEDKLKKTKEEAQRAREEKERVDNLTEEELAEYEKNIPEEKRRALVFVKEDTPGEPLSTKLRRKIWSFLKDSAIAEELKKNNVDMKEFEEELNKLSESGSRFKENVKIRVTDSENPVFKVARIAMDKVTVKGTRAAIERMKKIYPDFDVFDLEDDAKEIFTRLYESYLKRDEEYVSKVADGEALGFFKAAINRWEEMEVRPKVEKIWFLESVHLAQAEIISGYPIFRFAIKMQEIDCLVSTKTTDTEEEKEVIIQGSDQSVISNTYIVALTLHDNPDLETVGHEWKVTEFRLAEKHKMLV